MILNHLVHCHTFTFLKTCPTCRCATHPPCPDPRSPRVGKGFHERTLRAAEDNIEVGEEKDDDNDDDDDYDDDDDDD